MALCRLPNPALFASREWPSFPCASKSSGESLRWGAQQSPSCRALLLVCSAKNSRASRKSRATKSNAELCDELREFILVVGLPEHHVPSTKELLEHGRKDLANIVRRRGHRVIANLLTNPTNGDIAPEIGSTDSKISSKASEEHFVEDQGDQVIQYDMPGESLHELRAGSDHNGSLEKNRDTLEGEETPIYKYEPLSGVSYVNDAEGADSQLSFPYLKEQYTVREDAVSEEILDNSDFDENTSSDLAEEVENQAEIDHLRELLRKKELELSLLKQQLEEEKFSLSVMQNKAHSELSKVQDIISTKDEELQAAEESLSGLKEVTLEYWGNGETVEVTGSFNGWQHRLKMDQQMPSKTVNPPGPREATLWSTVLWLYPGVYEIKFIVDGHWKIDPQREFVSKDNIVNNILRVDRDDDPAHRQTL